ncbi:efflux RND transporter periplasmic adaptor subunit [Endozoicomonas sp. OPT23]|uniref:efflux RND transporter periplasmic adaptor subunit n=1 Tax=Endozoicomonas sp. OPT23 TaxID=2072845 RepID=UPI00129B00DC|nr:efflux RND transporter periplasmic adaptor subunit [Endozoicomonas sp. OPT23]MRI33477.1 efflux RND transporter periplasmic adaptor subunit [Endozoicomonas sp. OPT23]
MSCLRSGMFTGLLTLMSMVGMTNSSWAEERAPAVVNASEVQYQSHARPIRTSGILSYKSQQTLSFKTAGPINKLTVHEGDQVKAGQLLASLSLGEINAQVAEARARVELAKRNLERLRKLHASNVVSLDQFQSAETELEVAQSKLNVIRFNRKYSSIKAPVDGLVLRRFVESNELVTAYQPVLLVADTQQGWVIRTGVTDADIVRLQKNDTASVSFDAWPEHIFSGKITQLATLADEKTGTFEIEITLQDPEDRLRSGFIGRVNIHPAGTRQLTLIPMESIISIDGNYAEVFVYSLSSKIVSSRKAHLDYLEPGFAASNSGLKAGELLVTRGAGLLRAGEPAQLAATDSRSSDNTGE